MGVVHPLGVLDTAESVAVSFFSKYHTADPELVEDASGTPSDGTPADRTNTKMSQEWPSILTRRNVLFSTAIFELFQVENSQCSVSPTVRSCDGRVSWHLLDNLDPG